VGRLAQARRWDGAGLGAPTSSLPAGTPAVDLQYAYDVSDDRTLKTATDASGDQVTTVYVYDDLELRRAPFAGGDYRGTVQTEVPYLFAHGVRLARVQYATVDPVLMASGTTHVLLELKDHLGSSTTAIDQATSELVERSTYLAYGGADSDYRPAAWGSFREDYRFTGKEEDVEVGLDYFGKRFYAPLLGRWISADPLAVHSPGSADLNVFAYVHGRLLGSVDPLGLENQPIAGAPAPNNPPDGAPTPPKTPEEKAADEKANQEYAAAQTAQTQAAARAAAPPPASAGLLQVSAGPTGPGIVGGPLGATARFAGDNKAALATVPVVRIGVLVGSSATNAQNGNHAAAAADMAGAAAQAVPVLRAAMTASIAERAAVALSPGVLTPQSSGGPEEAVVLQFSQVTASPRFSDEGTYAGKTIGSLAAELRSDPSLASSVTVGYVTKDGHHLIVNTRSALALTRAGIPRSSWVLIDATESQSENIADRLARNRLGPEGTATLRITGLARERAI
jgi:RHS repeat-associated protein